MQRKSRFQFSGKAGVARKTTFQTPCAVAAPGEVAGDVAAAERERVDRVGGLAGGGVGE